MWSEGAPLTIYIRGVLLKPTKNNEVGTGKFAKFEPGTRCNRC